VVEQEDKQALMIQLRWTVPQQPLVTTHIQVIPTPQKIPLDIQHSTDTTAIWSFALSVFIALILGSLATWLAYWFGVRSFVLTKRSFDVVLNK